METIKARAGLSVSFGLLLSCFSALESSCSPCRSSVASRVGLSARSSLLPPFHSDFQLRFTPHSRQEALASIPPRKLQVFSDKTGRTIADFMMSLELSQASSTASSYEMSAPSFFRTGKKCVAIGRNYMKHVKELNNTAPKEPFFFLKPTSSYLANGGTIELPKGIDVHHEVELGVIIGKKARDVRASEAMKHVAGYTLAIDMTARNLQEEVKKKGLPWSAVKGYDTFCPVSDFLPADSVDDPHNLKLWLKINDQIKQSGTTGDMIFRIPELIEHVSGIMTLEEGDLLITGTPEGVGPLKHGDTVSATLESPDGKELLSWEGKAEDRKGGYHYKG